MLFYCSLDRLSSSVSSSAVYCAYTYIKTVEAWEKTKKKRKKKSRPKKAVAVNSSSEEEEEEEEGDDGFD